MARILEVPYSFGEVFAITGSGAKLMVWMKDENGAVRGIGLDLTNPAAPTLTRDEIIIRRKTEGLVRRKKLPPAGQSFAPPTM